MSLKELDERIEKGKGIERLVQHEDWSFLKTVAEEFIATQFEKMTNPETSPEDLKKAQLVFLTANQFWDNFGDVIQDGKQAKLDKDNLENNQGERPLKADI